MSRGKRWTAQEMTARGWVDPAHPQSIATVAQGDQYCGACKCAYWAKDGHRCQWQFVPPVRFEPNPPPDPTTSVSAKGKRRVSGSTCPTKRPRKPSKAVPYERDVLKAVLACLRAHPRVSWAVRLNSGMAMLPGRGGKPMPVRFGFPGCPDVVGQMVGGAFLAVEVKRPGKHPTLEQAAFLLRVREAGGTAFVADGVDAVLEELGPLTRREQLGD